MSELKSEDQITGFDDMHLAIVGPYPPSLTGIGQYGYHLSLGLAQSRLFTRITVLTSSSSGQQPVELPAPIEVQSAWQPDQVDAGLSVMAQLRRLQPDVVWFNLGTSVFGRNPLANLSGSLAPGQAQRAGFPTIVTLHELAELADLRTLHAPGGPLAIYGAQLLTRVAMQADVVCLTMRRYVDWLSARRPELRCLHIPIGAYHTPERLTENAAAELLFFTTLAPFKGLEVLLEAFQTLQTSHPNLRLTIAGAEHARFPGYAQKIRQAYRQVSGVRWRGQVPESEVRGLFEQAQIMVLPYNASTGASSVLVQAASWGRPVVASDLSETLAVARENGLKVALFQRGEAHSLAAVLRTQLDSAQERRAQVEHNFAAVLRNRPEETCRAYLQAFNLALESRSSPKRIAISTLTTAERI
jgi:glycosyltransferase involved in cell wall biosynthesis